MKDKLLDIYSDYLICQNKYATATGLSDLLNQGNLKVATNNWNWYVRAGFL